MVNTNKVVGFYTDAFGNEVEIYEEVSRYSVYYKGYICYEDKDGDNWNQADFDCWEDAKSFYDFYAYRENRMYIEDNQYEVTYKDGEWY